MFSQFYSFGSGYRGKLGHGTQDTLESPKLVEALQGRRVTSVSCGAWTTLLLLDNGEVWGMGLARNGRLPLANPDSLDSVSSFGSKSVQFVDVPTKLETGGRRIRQVAAGGYHLLMLSEEGELLACGSNQNGQCGCERRGINHEQFIMTPRVVPYSSETSDPNEGIKNIYASWKTSGFITFGGDAYLFGLNCCSQLSGTFMDRVTPTLVQIIDQSLGGDGDHEGTTVKRRVLKMALGQMHTALLSEDGLVYTMGSPANGRLGYRIGPDQRYQSTPKCIDALRKHKVIDISSGFCHTVALTTQGQVFAWGSGSEGQTGTGSLDSGIYTPQRVVLDQPVTRISSGGFCTVFVTESQDLWYTGLEFKATMADREEQDDIVISQDVISSVPRKLQLPRSSASPSAVSHSAHVSVGGSHVAILIVRDWERHMQFMLSKSSSSRDVEVVCRV